MKIIRIIKLCIKVSDYNLYSFSIIIYYNIKLLCSKNKTEYKILAQFLIVRGAITFLN